MGWRNKGMNYRNIVICLGLLLVLGCSDLGTSDLKAHHSNTHEILVNYCIKIEPKLKIQSHINPRFLK